MNFGGGLMTGVAYSPNMPNRAEAIRRLVAIGLRADPPTQRLTPVKGKPEPKK
jgi:hypothetical protein